MSHLKPKYSLRLEGGMTVADFGTDGEVCASLQEQRRENPAEFFYIDFLRFAQVLYGTRFTKAPRMFGKFIELFGKLTTVDPNVLYDGCRSIYLQHPEWFTTDDKKQLETVNQLCPFYLHRDMSRLMRNRLRETFYSSEVPPFIVEHIVGYCNEHISTSSHQPILLLQSLHPTAKLLEWEFLFATLDFNSLSFIWMRLCSVFHDAFNHLLLALQAQAPSLVSEAK
jgi:hypothetical protein